MLTLSVLLLGTALGACHADASGDPSGNAAPVITITSPSSGSSVAESTEVLFAGSASDAEEGALADSLLQWSSNLDGAIGTGDSVRLSTLTPGRHTITLQATDTAGATGKKTVTLTIVGSAPVLGLDTIASGLSSPVFLTAPPGDTGRLFIVEQSGTIRIIKHGTLLGTPFLDLSDSLSTGGEQGLLGLAFAPDYATSGRFYVSYSNKHGSLAAGTAVIERYTVSANPDLANPASGQRLLTLDDPYDNHNGGQISFGPDTYLYYGMGDGGGGGDPLNSGQDRGDWFASMLRLDVSGGGAYTVPATNPFTGNPSYKPELWNYGLRNPWRWSFDRSTGDLYIGDVGQNAYEEVDVQPAASAGGENYGWSTMEGTHCYGSAGCNTSGKVLPVVEYGHGQGCAVTGGYVYRGSAIPSLVGHYLYADYCSGWVRSFQYAGGVATNLQDRDELIPGGNITSFGEDAAGELYILTQGGRVHRIVQR